MGRIKPRMVKNTSKALTRENKEFQENFDFNKKLLGDNMPSKKIRNKIAGYLARLVKVEKANAI